MMRDKLYFPKPKNQSGDVNNPRICQTVSLPMYKTGGHAQEQPEFSQQDGLAGAPNARGALQSTACRPSSFTKARARSKKCKTSTPTGKSLKTSKISDKRLEYINFGPQSHAILASSSGAAPAHAEDYAGSCAGTKSFKLLAEHLAETGTNH